VNKLEIFQEVYGKDYVFTVTELSRLQRVAELIVQERARVLEGKNQELAAEALDKAVPETWTTLTHDQLLRFQEVFADLIIKELNNENNA